MTTRQFNDRVVRTGSMPLTRDYRAQWKFYGAVPEAN
jgi:hypothetical protein